MNPVNLDGALTTGSPANARDAPHVGMLRIPSHDWALMDARVLDNPPTVDGGTPLSCA